MSEEDQKKFWESHTKLKAHAQPDIKDTFVQHSQTIRKKKLDVCYKVPCPDQQDVFLVYAQDHKKNKFKLNKLKQRGDCTLGGRPKKVKELCEKCEEQVAPQVTA